MKKLSLLLILAGTAFGQNIPSTFSGLYQARSFNYAPVTVGIANNSTGAGMITLQIGQAVTKDGIVFNPITTTTPITVGLGAGVETVTPTSVNCTTPTVNNTCQVSATFSFIHGYGDPVSSGTFGLQEALNYAGTKGGGEVIVDAQWYNLGGTGTMKTNATIPANTGIGDSSTGSFAGGGAGGPLLKTNSVTNSVQNVLNLKQGSNVTLASDVSGGVTISSALSNSSTVFVVDSFPGGGCTVSAVVYTTQVDCAYATAMAAAVAGNIVVTLEAGNNNYLTNLGFVEPAGGNVGVSILGIGSTQHAGSGTMFTANASMASMLSHVAGTQLGGLRFSGFALNGNSLSGQCMVLASMKDTAADDIICLHMTTTTGAWVNFGIVGSGNNGFQNVYTNIFVDNGGSPASSWAQITPTITSGNLSFAVASGGTYINAQPPVFVYGYGAGANPCTSMGTISAVMTGTAVTGITASGFTGCSGTVYVSVPDLAPAPFGFQWYDTDSTFKDLVIQNVGQRYGFDSESGGNTIIHAHAYRGIPIQVHEHQKNAWYNYECDSPGHYCIEVQQNFPDKIFFDDTLQVYDGIYPGASFMLINGTNNMVVLNGLTCGVPQNHGDYHEFVTIAGGPVDTGQGDLPNQVQATNMNFCGDSTGAFVSKFGFEEIKDYKPLNTLVERYKNNGVQRWSRDSSGSVTANLNSTATEVGSFEIGTPGGFPGLILRDSAGASRSNIGLKAGGGLLFSADTTSVGAPETFTILPGQTGSVIHAYPNGTGTDVDCMGFEADRSFICYDGVRGNALIQAAAGKGIDLSTNNATPGSGTVGLTVNPTGQAIFPLQMTIGATSAPVDPLDINGTGLLMRLGLSGAAGATIYGDIDNGRAQWGYDNAGGNAVFQGGTNKGIQLYTNGSSFVTGGTAAFTLSSAGNGTLPGSLTIGSSTGPTDPLDINGTGLVFRMGLSGSAGATIYGDIDNGRTQFGYDNATGNANLQGGTGHGVELYTNGSGLGSGGQAVLTGTSAGVVTIPKLVAGTIGTSGNCNSVASPASCGGSQSGTVGFAAGGTTYVVNTTAVTANSNIFVQNDSSLGTRLGVTCNTQGSLVIGTPIVTARTAGTSFTVSLDVAPTTNRVCLNYLIVN